MITELDFKTVDGMFIKQIWVPKAKTFIEMHAHKYSHSTLLAKGKILVWTELRPDTIYEAPATIVIPAQIKHQYQTLEDETLLYCLHNLHGAEEVEVLNAAGLSQEDLIDG